MASLGSALASAFKWLRAFAPLGITGASIVAVDSLQEYAIGIALLVLAFGGFAAQIHEWKGVEGRRTLTLISKSILWTITAFILILLAVVYVKLKGPKAWSNIETLDKVVIRLITDAGYVYNTAPWRLLASFAAGCVLTFLIIWFQRRTERKASPNPPDASAPQQGVETSDSLRGCQDEWLHEKLKTDKATIWDLVWVASIFYRRDFDKSQPRIDFVFNIFNNSLLDVVISMDGGYILFSDDNEQFHFDPKFIAQNPALCRSRDSTNFVIRQAVTRDEITNHFKDADNTRISFGNLRVTFRGTEQFPEITRTNLDVNHYLFTREGVWHNPNRPKLLSEQELRLQNIQASPMETERANLVFLRVDEVLVYYNEIRKAIVKYDNQPRTASWRQKHPSFEVLVAYYRNVPQEGVKPRAITKLSAELIYDPLNEPYIVPRAQWFPQNETRVDIPSNDAAGFILAERHKSETIYARDGRDEDDIVNLAERGITVSVRFFSAYDGSTIEGGKFKIENIKTENSSDFGATKID